MPATLVVLSVIVGILAVLQGWQMVKTRNHHTVSLDDDPILNDISAKLDTVIGKLGKIEMRLNDIWGKVNR